MYGRPPAAPVPVAPALGSPVPGPASVPFTVHARVAASSLGVRSGYGSRTTAGSLSTGPRPTGGSLAAAVGRGAVPASRRPLTSRLERRVRVRSRRRADDEFRRAFRAELFSDDARYGVLLALTASWYGPVALVFLVWALLADTDAATGGRVVSGLLWLAAAAVLSLAVVSLLRWARVGWRALTLSVASALIGGGLATVAHTLAG